MQIEALSTLIQSRRTINPPLYKGGDISDSIVENILQNAIWAPTHRKSQPWRFSVVKGGALVGLADYMADYYTTNTPSENFSEIALQKNKQNILNSSCIIAIGVEYSPEGFLPEWEETACVAMAVQNMWLSCTAAGLGSYWGSSKPTLNAGEYVGFNSDTKCLGFFYIGIPKDDIPAPVSVRKPMDEVVIWNNKG